jgi:1-phosphatidylinositol-4-phosphate 5-kinase
LKYYDIQVNGSKSQRNEIIYYLIDDEKKGFFTIKDFAILIKHLVDSWVNVTNINTDN